MSVVILLSVLQGKRKRASLNENELSSRSSAESEVEPEQNLKQHKNKKRAKVKPTKKKRKVGKKKKMNVFSSEQRYTFNFYLVTFYSLSCKNSPI